MDVLSRITESNGFLITFTGIGTVFITLCLIWAFISLYARFMEGGSKPGNEEEDDCVIPDQSETALQTDSAEPSGKPDVTSEVVITQQATDDLLPRMAAAAAVAAYLKRRQSRNVPKTIYLGTPWGQAGKLEAIHNLPPRDSWRR